MTRRLGWVVAALAAAVLGGCGDDDGDNLIISPPPKYPAHDSPRNVLEAMQLAYQNRDSTEYKAVYDTSYMGTSQDLNDPPGTQISIFRYADEVAHMGTLARSTTISSIVLDLGLPSSWTRLPSDDLSHPEWAMIQISAFRLDLYDGSTLYSAQSNDMTFSFRPIVTTPPDTTWTIVRWLENGSSGP